MPRTNSKVKKPRGRPKGTAPFEEADHETLAKFADQYLQSPSAKLAPFLKAQGYEEKDVRRAQLRWRMGKSKFLEEAQLRLDLSPAESAESLAFHFYAAIDALRKEAEPSLGMIAASYERAKRRVRALQKTGQQLGLPIDLEAPSDVQAALTRYESQMFDSEERRFDKFGQLKIDELPPALKLYATALMLHELSLQMSDAADGRSNPYSIGEVDEGEGRP